MTKTDRNGNTITYSYDNLNRMTAKQYPNSGGTVNYTYDLENRLTQVSDATGTYGFTYDDMGRLTGTSTQYSFLPGNTYTNTYSYDAASNRTGFTAPDGSTNIYAYDSLNRLSTLTNSLTGQFGFGYDALSRRTSLTRPNGVNTSYSYDSLSHLLSILHQSAGVTLDGAVYTYDNTGNRLSKLNELNGITENYGYDKIYQLAQVQQILNGSPATTESYSYDLVGNRLSSLNVSSYSYNSSNELTSSADGYTYTYDNNGNTLTRTLSGNTTSYTWDYENRLLQVTLPGTGGTVTFKYDSFGRRVQKSGPSGTTNYLYDDKSTVEELDATGNVLTHYSVGSDIDEPLSAVLSSTTGYYQADGVGTITALTSTSGTLAQTYTYQTFGGLVASSGSLPSPFQFTGRESDPDAGLFYYRARYYDSINGRFISEDPARFPGGVDFYAYVENNPINLVDPFGFCPWEIHTRPLKGVPGAGPLGLDHYYFYNPQTGQSIGLGPAGGTLNGPVPGNWETHEKPGNKVGPVPDWACNCVDNKAKHPGKPPNYCTFQGNAGHQPHPPCTNCIGWVQAVLQDCYNQASGGQK